MERKPAVAVVFHHIGPYHHTRLNAAADRLTVIGIEWSAKAYDAWGAADSRARYHKVSLFREATEKHPGKAELQRAFRSALEQTNPDVVAVNGWNNFGSLIAANCCLRRGIPMVVMSESARGDEPRMRWKETIKRRIIQAYAQYRSRLQGTGVTDPGYNGRAPWHLVLLGDGPLRESLNSQLSTLNFHQHVHLPGFKPYDELPIYYALANAFVHASTTEQWGLVVNEAIASGLPVIVSERCGCVPELVQDNGSTFDPTNEHELAARLLEVAVLPREERERLAQASYEIAANFAPERFGEGLERAVTAAMGLPQRRFAIINRALLLAAKTYEQ